MGLFSKIAEGLKKTKDSFLGGLQRIFNSFTKIDEELFEELEEQMIMSDIGVDTSVEICDRVRKLVKERGITDPNDIMELIHEVISDIMGDDTGLDLSVSPAVIMVIGVNGAGKTTTIGKLCHQFKQEGKKVLVAAADTFRAAAIDQLQVWTERAGVEIVKHAEGSDPGAVVFDSLEAAKARNCDVVVIDTAGRLHNTICQKRPKLLLCKLFYTFISITVYCGVTSPESVWRSRSLAIGKHFQVYSFCLQMRRQSLVPVGDLSR